MTETATLRKKVVSSVKEQASTSVSMLKQQQGSAWLPLVLLRPLGMAKRAELASNVAGGSIFP